MIDLTTLRRVLDQAAHDVDREQVPQLLAALEAAKARIWASLLPQPPQPTVAPKLVNAEELAAASGVPASWFRDAARRGLIPCVRHGLHVRFEPDAVREALRGQPGLRRRRRTVSRDCR